VTLKFYLLPVEFLTKFTQYIIKMIVASTGNHKFNKLIIYYFTGTGNAKQVANWIIEDAKTRGIETHLVNIGKPENIDDIEITKNTLIGFCYPTHGFNAPPIVLKQLWNFSKSKFNNNFFVANTRAGMKMGKLFTPGLSGIALLLPALILFLKGYKLIGYRSIDLPSNWISIHPGLKEKVVLSIFNRCKQITINFSDKILNGKKLLKGFWTLPIDLAISPIAVAYYLFGRFALSKTYIATDACNQCGLCVENCPVHAISMKDNKPYWSYKCESCMQCMNNCPQRAIETPHGFITIIWWFAFSILPLFILNFINNYVDAKSFLNDIVYYVLFTITSFLVIFGSYRVIHFLMKFNLINKIIATTSLTSYRFWRRYKAPKNL